MFVFVFIIECVFRSHVCVFHTRQSFFVVFRPALVSITADGVDKLNDRVGCSNRPDPATETAHRRLFSALVLSPLYPLRFYFCPRHSWPLCLLPFFSQFSFFFLNCGSKVTVGQKTSTKAAPCTDLKVNIFFHLTSPSLFGKNASVWKGEELLLGGTFPFSILFWNEPCGHAATTWQQPDQISAAPGRVWLGDNDSLACLRFFKTNTVAPRCTVQQLSGEMDRREKDNLVHMVFICILIFGGHIPHVHSSFKGSVCNTEWHLVTRKQCQFIFSYAILNIFDLTSFILPVVICRAAVRHST